MGKHSVVKLNFESFKDSDSGLTVTRLTPTDVLCHRNYFYQKCFTNDGSKLLFAGEFDGNRNYYLLDLKKQEALQLTEGAGDNTFGGFLSPDDDFLYYVKNGRYLKRVNLSSLEEETVYSVPDDWVGYGTWVANSACTSLVGIEIAKSDWTPLTDWKIFNDFYSKKPHCRLIRVDLKTGETQPIIDQNVWLGHPIYRPFDDDTIAFCHEGPHDQVDSRVWLTNQAGSNIRKIRQQEVGESCMHEFWVPDGSALIYVSYIKGEQARHIRQFDPEQNQDRILIDMPACSHLMSNYDGSLLVGDGTGSPVDVIDKCGYKIENDPWLYLFDIKNQETVKVVKHNSSWKVLDGDRQVTHPHPSFSPNDEYILFTSDFEGQPALYLSELPKK